MEHYHEKKASKYHRCPSMQNVSTHALTVIRLIQEQNGEKPLSQGAVYQSISACHAFVCKFPLYVFLIKNYKITRIISMDISASNDTKSLH